MTAGAALAAWLATTPAAPAQQAPERRTLSEPTAAERPPVRTAPAAATGVPRVRDNARPIPTVRNPGFGRVPIDNFSFGLETDRKLKPDQFPDGRQFPGLESHRRENQSPFIGLSVSVPTN